MKAKTKRSKKKRKKMDYRSLFFMGLIWFVLGITTDITVFFILGMAYIAMALANKRKRGKSRKKLNKTYKKLVYALTVLLILGVILAVLLKTGIVDIRGYCACRGINNFEECIAAGYPAMESYPRQCRACGRTFVEEIGSKACVVDDDCVVFGETGDCNCGCYNRNSLPSGPGGECFCVAPTSCECVNGECEGVFE